MSPIIVALDYPDSATAITLAQRLDPARCRLKVGKELFTCAGPGVVEALHKLGFEVFLDLKFHDIPNTASKAVKAAAELGVWMVNVHASGGRRMMAACREVLEQRAGVNPLLIAVTVLTSMEKPDLADIGLDIDPLDQVRRLARLTRDSGLDGVVCSAQEVTMLREELGNDFSLVTPGIRPVDSDKGDQRRIVTPQQALAMGSSYLVIGRPITQADDPAHALDAILSSLN
ncbi:orotidine-5'-phosphate decarboxylase [Aestuariirhabdus sp. LZHN29]|uniref:orotidine-5'-phosphate decarboxylase n=1 Tax=Aestuariirhabdus sp. LZHN29 TaxID=3417462 RepID=UPI003CF06DA8